MRSGRGSSAHRKTLLDQDDAGMVWEPAEEAWENKLATLRSYHRHHGHLAPGQDAVWGERDSNTGQVGSLARLADYDAQSSAICRASAKCLPCIPASRLSKSGVSPCTAPHSASWLVHQLASGPNRATTRSAMRSAASAGRCR